MEDRFKFRVAEFSDKNNFIKFEYYEIGDEIYYPLCGDISSPQMCIGIKDVEGKLLYEGDIVTVFYVTSSMQGRTLNSVVQWNNLSHRFDLKGYGTLEEDDVIKIVGNIYENPELLEV